MNILQRLEMGRSYSGLLWTLAAACSIVSSKYLLIDRNFHFTNLLLISHAACAACVQAFVLFYWKPSSGREESLLSRCRGNLQTPFFLVLGAFASAVSLLTAYQSLIHMPNIATQMMVLSVNLRPEALVANLSLATIGRYVALLAAGMVAFLFDYRIDLNGNLNGQILILISAGCFALSRWCRTYVCTRNSDFGAQRMSNYFNLSLFIAVVVIAARETVNDYRIPTPDGKFSGHMLLFIGNVLVSVMVLVFRGSVFQALPSTEVYGDTSGEVSLGGDLEATCLGAVLTSVATLLYTFLARASIITMPQCICFFLACGLAYSRQEWREAIDTYKRNGYRLVLNTKANLPTDEDDDGWDLTPEVQPPTQSILSIASLSLLLFTWCIVFWWSITGRPYSFTTARTPHVDVDYTSTRKLDIVMARYSEDLDEVVQMLGRITRLPNMKDLNPKIIIYDKYMNETRPSLEHLLDKSPGKLDIEFVDRPNIGREAETYLWHISNQYDDLATHTLFMQAGLENWRSALKRIEQYFNPKTGFLSLSYSGQICWDCNSCGDRASWYEHPELLNRLHNMSNPDSPCSPLLRTYKGQFFASASRVRGTPRARWQEMLDLFANPDSEVHKKPYLQPWNERIRVDHMSAPILGFTFERLWGDLMQCSEMRIAERCPSLVSGLYGWKGELEDCQCLD